MNENKRKLAKYAGILYLLIAIISPVAILYIPSQVMASSVKQTIQNILNHETLFQFGAGLEIVVCLLEILLSVFLYQIFQKVNPTLSVISLVSRLSMTLIQAINAVASLTAVGLLSSPLTHGENINQIIFTFLKYKEYGILVWQMFFGLHLITLGYLVYKSGYLSKYFGSLLMLSSLGYLVDSYIGIFSLDISILNVIGAMLLGISTFGEVTFMIRLLTRDIFILTEEGQNIRNIEINS